MVIKFLKNIRDRFSFALAKLCSRKSSRNSSPVTVEATEVVEAAVVANGPAMANAVEAIILSVEVKESEEVKALVAVKVPSVVNIGEETKEGRTKFCHYWMSWMAAHRMGIVPASSFKMVKSDCPYIQVV